MPNKCSYDLLVLRVGVVAETVKEQYYQQLVFFWTISWDELRIMALSLRRFTALPKIVQVVQLATPSPGYSEPIICLCLSLPLHKERLECYHPFKMLLEK